MNNHQSQRAEQDQQFAPANTSAGNKQADNDQNNPANRLQDGTNDFQNGDQEPSSERSSKDEKGTQNR